MSPTASTSRAQAVRKEMGVAGKSPGGTKPPGTRALPGTVGKETPRAGARVEVSSPSKPQEESKLKSNNESNEISPCHMKDPAAKYCSTITSEQSRCRHLEEQMFPRYLSLDCKQMDEFCTGCVKDKRSTKNLGRLYIEALHLKDFLKSPDAIVAHNAALFKGKGKRGRGNADAPSKKKSRSCPSERSNEKNDEQATDNKRLSQSYFGGFEGKRTWFLANSHKLGKGGGVAGSYCNVLPSSALDAIGTEGGSTTTKKSDKKSKKCGSPSSENALDSLLSTEVKLAVLRKSMRLHDQTVPSPDDTSPELILLESLVKPLPGYTPDNMNTSSNVNTPSGRAESRVKSGVAFAKVEVEHISVASAAADAPTSTPVVGSQPMDVDLKRNKNDTPKKPHESIEPEPTPSNEKVGSSIVKIAMPDTPSSSGGTRLKGGPPKSASKQICTPAVPYDRLQSNFERAICEGKEAALAADKLLESFRCNRRNYWNHVLKNEKAATCAWCPPGCNGSASAERESNSEFGVIGESAASTDHLVDDIGRSSGATGDSLIQCLECDLIGCAPRAFSGIKHAMLHFLMSGHRFGVTCGARGEVFCMGCGDNVYHECFDQERERIALEQNIPLLCWKETPVIRGVYPSSFMLTPENGVVWRGMMASYPSPVSPQLVQASQLALKRFSIFRGDTSNRLFEWGANAIELATYQREQLDGITRPVGMYNLGNTCFMSATLQCLIHCKPLQEQFLSKLAHPYQTCYCVRAGSKTTSCLTCEMDKVFLKYYGNSVGIDAIASLEEQPSHSTDTNPTTTRVAPSDSRGHPIIPSNLLAEIWKCKGMKHIAGHAQHDAQEFFNAFVDCLSAQALVYRKLAQEKSQIVYERQIKRPQSNENQDDSSDKDFISKLFLGTLRSVLICQKCGCKRTQTESFSNVSLPLAKELSTSKDSRPTTRRGKISVKSILNHFTRPETLADSVHCPSCNSKTKTLKQHTFSKLPDVLCLHLKRFDSAGNKKITDFVPFPASGLDMGKHLPHWCERGLETKNKSNGEHSAASPKVLYDLFATVNHRGTLHQGHYIANVKSGNCWYSCNDAFVSKAGADDGEKEVLASDGAYMLFYLKR